jgi:tyrosyl-tRNA synthetase
LFVELGLASSKKEARRLIQGGGARKGDTDKISDENGSLTVADFGDSNEITLRAGKKRAGVVELKD